MPISSQLKDVTGNACIYRGTFIAWELLSEFAVVGADTRTLDEFSKSAYYCKILPLSDHVVFFSSGLGTIKDHWGRIMFDINRSARRAFVLSGQGIDPHTIAKIFANQTIWEITNVAGQTGKTYETGNDGLVLQASFIGGDQNLSEANIIIEVDPDNAYQATITGYSPHGLAITGYQDVLWSHVTAADADALKTTADRLKNASDLSTFENNQAALIDRAVRAVIDHCGDELIGGEPAVAILDLKTGFRWFRQPLVCQEQ